MKKTTIIIGVSGPTASGKSLLANTIVSELGSQEAIVIPEDSYYKDHPDLSMAERSQINYDHPNAYDHELLIKHLHELQKGNAIDMPLYSHAEHRRKAETKRAEPHHIIVLEGILLFVDPELRKMLDICVFMDTPLDICLIRRLKRDTVERNRSLDSVLEQYQRTVRPMYFQFVEPSKRHADIIVPRGGENRIAIDMLKAKMTELLTELTGK